jgi:hypothetical protein
VGGTVDVAAAIGAAAVDVAVIAAIVVAVAIVVDFTPGKRHTGVV